MSAARAKTQLDGADIYAGCCTLKIEFARVSCFENISEMLIVLWWLFFIVQTKKLNVYKNDDMTWDFTSQGTMKGVCKQLDKVQWHVSSIVGIVYFHPVHSHVTWHVTHSTNMSHDIPPTPLTCHMTCHPFHSHVTWHATHSTHMSHDMHIKTNAHPFIQYRAGLVPPVQSVSWYICGLWPPANVWCVLCTFHLWPMCQFSSTLVCITLSLLWCVCACAWKCIHA